MSNLTPRYSIGEPGPTTKYGVLGPSPKPSEEDLDKAIVAAITKKFKYYVILHDGASFKTFDTTEEIEEYLNKPGAPEDPIIIYGKLCVIAERKTVFISMKEE